MFSAKEVIDQPCLSLTYGEINRLMSLTSNPGFKPLMENWSVPLSPFTPLRLTSTADPIDPGESIPQYQKVQSFATSQLETSGVPKITLLPGFGMLASGYVWRAA